MNDDTLISEAFFPDRNRVRILNVLHEKKIATVGQMRAARNDLRWARNIGRVSMMMIDSVLAKADVTHLRRPVAVELSLLITAEMHAHLQKLVATGLHGFSIEQAAEDLLRDRLRSIALNQ